MPQISKHDFDKAVRYLEDAAKFYSRSTGSRCLDRARLIRLLVNRLNKSHKQHKTSKK